MSLCVFALVASVFMPVSLLTPMASDLMVTEAIPILMSVIAVALIPLGSWTIPVAVLLGLWGLMATATPVVWWSWIAQAMPDDAEAGGGLMVAIIQFAIALGSTIGGLLFDSSGYQSTFIASAVVLLIGAFLTFQTSRAQAQQGA
jgi:predicted MFS family arabinose efflux permease